MMEDKAILKLFGEGTRIISKNKDITFIDYGVEEGKASIIMYDVFPGILVTINDFWSESSYRTVEKQEMLEINHCLRGRFECHFEKQKVMCMGEGDLSVNGMKHLPFYTSFPLRNYYGISVLINPREAKKCQILKEFSIDFDELYDKYELDKKCHVFHRNERIEHLFSEIYEQVPNIKIQYLKFKIIEMFYYLQEIELQNADEWEYLSKANVDKVKQLREYMVANIDKKIPLEELARKYNISLTQMKKYFKDIYGDTPYSYLKIYKMNLAAKKLVESNKNINELAMELSYTNASKFSEAFYSVIGMSPKEYRIKNRKTDLME